MTSDSEPFGEVLRHATRHPTAHRITHDMGTIGAQCVDHRYDVARTFHDPITIEFFRLVTVAVAERIDGCDRESIGQPVDETTFAPARFVTQEAVLQDDEQAVPATS